MNSATKSIEGILGKNFLIGYYLLVFHIIIRILLILTDSHIFLSSPFSCFFDHNIC